MISKALYSSRNENWGTPQKLFDDLNDEFHFSLDAAANDKNAKCEHYFTLKQDALLQDWSTPKGNAVFVNPPYGKNIWAWCKKAYEESQKGTTVVMLIHARTDTRWFHNWVYGKAELRFIKGRLHFIDETGQEGDAAPFPSMIAIYRGEEKRD